MFSDLVFHIVAIGNVPVRGIITSVQQIRSTYSAKELVKFGLSLLLVMLI